MNDTCVHIIDLQSDDIQNKFTITIYGKTINGENIVCHVTDFKPSFYVKIPENWSSNKVETNIINEIKKNLKFWELKFIKVNLKNPIYNYDFYGYNWDFKNDCRKRYKFIELEFENYRSYNKYKSEIQNLFKSKDKKLDEWRNICTEECNSNLYEANIHPIIRFIHITNIKPSGWIEIRGKNVKEITEKSFKCDKEYECKYKNIKPYDNNDLSDIIIASFDIECDSFTGEFPQANKDLKGLSVNIYDIYNNWYDNTYDYESKYNFINGIIKQAFSDDDICYKEDVNRIYSENGEPVNIKKCSIFNEEFIDKLDKSITEKKNRNNIIDEIRDILNDELKNSKGNNIVIKGDPIIQIGTVFYYTNSKKYLRYIQVIKPDDKDEKICDGLEEYDIIVEECKNERELLIKWKKCINKINPDMITGYNIFGFDFDYIGQRANKFFKCGDKNPNTTFYNLGRLDMESENANDHYMKKCKQLTKRLASSALGDNTLKYFNMDGRVLFDVQKEIQKGHNLESYKLDNVASHFMRGKINEFSIFNCNDTFGKIWSIHTDTIGHLKNGDYITINLHSNIGEVLLYNGKKFKIYKIKNKNIK